MLKNSTTVTISTAPIIGYDKIMTAEAFNNYIIFGGTIGFWLAVFGAASLVLLLGLNLKRFYSEVLKPML